MPTSSKFQREAKRLGGQIQDLFVQTGVPFLLGFGAGQAKRRALRAASQTYPGARKIENHAALYLIFPAQGLLDSHLVALDYLNGCGYAPVVVSNLPLSKNDLLQVQARSAMVAVRPNFGYDFGGYEHGVFLLQDHLPRLQYLAIFNDSVWFPIDTGWNWFAQAEGLGKDMVGAYARSAMKAPRDKDPAALRWSWDTHHHRFHYSSFALLLSSRALLSPAFTQFWARYVATDDKIGTVRRGEIGLTRTLVRAGLSHGATYPTEDLPQQIAALEEDTLQHLASTLIHEDRALYTRLTRGRAEAGPDQLRQILLAVIARQGPAYSWAPYDLAHRNGQFVKKAPVSWSKTSARSTMAMLARPSCPEAFLAEAKAMAARQGFDSR